MRSYGWLLGVAGLEPNRALFQPLLSTMLLPDVMARWTPAMYTDANGRHRVVHTTGAGESAIHMLKSRIM